MTAILNLTKNLQKTLKYREDHPDEEERQSGESGIDKLVIGLQRLRHPHEVVDRDGGKAEVHCEEDYRSGLHELPACVHLRNCG